MTSKMYGTSSSEEEVQAIYQAISYGRISEALQLVRNKDVTSLRFTSQGWNILQVAIIFHRINLLEYLISQPYAYELLTHHDAVISLSLIVSPSCVE